MRLAVLLLLEDTEFSGEASFMGGKNASLISYGIAAFFETDIMGIK